VTGVQGACKTSFTRVLRLLVDPSGTKDRALPRENRDLFIAATNSWLLAYDNISHIPDWISDTLCRLSTGGGFATRQLYSDADEQLFEAMRPVTLNGIEDFVERPDLADRSVFLTLDDVPDEDRRDEAEFWAAFEKAKPQILGALLDMVVHGLQQLPTIKLACKPRMADFATWATACETAAWPAGTFMAAYQANRQGAVETVLEGDIVATMLRSFMATLSAWTGTATELLKALTDHAGEVIARAKDWPKKPNVLSGRLRRAETLLPKVGIRVSFDPGHGKSRTIRVAADGGARPSAEPFARPLGEACDEAGGRAGLGDAQPESEGKTSSAPSASSAPETNQALRPAAADDRGRSADDRTDSSFARNPLKRQGQDDADGQDDENGTLTGGHRQGAAGRGVGHVCAQCHSRPDGQEHPYAIGGSTVWLHPECVRFYGAATPSPEPGNGAQRPAPVCEQCSTSDGDLREYRATLPDGSDRGVCAPPSPKVAPSSEPLDPLDIPPFLRRAPP
jgi:hypothetical protein